MDFACYVGTCPTGYSPNDRARTCVKSTLPNGCTAPFYLQGSDCVNNCDPGFYPDQQTRVCLPCSANCASCSGPSVCTFCTSGTTLNNGVCVTSSLNCPSGQFKYNDICVNSCPAGAFNREGYCVRQCATNLYYWQGGCYEICPTNLRTADACALVCPIGFVKKDLVCVPISNQQCAPSQYFNSVIGICDNCKYPCTSCQGTSTFCTSCPNGFDLRAGGLCASNTICPSGSYSTPSGCQRCNTKCATCSDFNVCTSCAAGFTNTGADCVRSGSLQPVTLRQSGIYKRDNIVYVQL